MGQGIPVGTTRQRIRVGTVEPVAFGTAELVPDPARPGGWALLVDGVAQSYVDLDDPTHLEFVYVRQIAAIIDVAAAPAGPLRTLHLGGGGLTLPRYVAATRPGSPQTVVERDEPLLGLVRRLLPWPTDIPIRVDLRDAGEWVLGCADAAVDLVVSDVYEGAQMSLDVATAGFAAQLARVLRPEGLCVVNVTDDPPLAFSRVQAATLRSAFAEVCVVTTTRMLGGRRVGNVVLAATNRAAGLPRLVARPDWAVVCGDDFDRFVADVRPLGQHLTADRPR